MAIVPDTEAPPTEPAPPKPDPIAEALARLMNRTPEEILADRERILAASPPSPATARQNMDRHGGRPVAGG